MGSRIKSQHSRFFDCFLEIQCPSDTKEPAILHSYPFQYKESEANKLKPVPNFAFPCQLQISTVQNFSFVLTDEAGRWTFGFCRHAPRAKTAFVILSSVPWHSLFFSILNHAGELCSGATNNNSGGVGSDYNDVYCEGEMWKFVEACYNSKLPLPGNLFHVSWNSNSPGGGGHTRDFTQQTPHNRDLPEIPENRNLLEYVNAVGLDTMLKVFASMLHERRIVIVSSKLHRLSACVQAANAIIYPMFWQHIFIPILPKNLIGYLNAPMPFLIGVPAPVMETVQRDELGEVVVVDADRNTVDSPFQDLLGLPNDLVANFKRSQKDMSSSHMGGDAVARLFLRAIVHLIGGYGLALKNRPGEKITFDDHAFLSTRSSSVRPFLESMLELQIFRQFVEDRLQLLNEGKGSSDEFEKEIIYFSEERLSKNNNTAKIKTQAAAIGTSVKKEGAKAVRAVRDQADSVKTQVDPAVRKAVKSVKSTSKSAYKGVKKKMNTAGSTNLNPVRGGLPSISSSRTGSGSSLGSRLGVSDASDKHRSAPSSPVLNGRKGGVGGGFLPGGEERLTGGDTGSFHGSTGTGSSLNSKSSDADNKGTMLRANTELGFVPRGIGNRSGAVFKYDRFDPPPVTVTNNNTADSPPGKEHDTSPEFEALPPLNLDLMSEPEMQDLFNRHRQQSPVQDISSRHQTQQTPSTSPPVQDLITFQLSNTEEHEVIFDPLAVKNELESAPVTAPPRRVSNTQKVNSTTPSLPMPPVAAAVAVACHSFVPATSTQHPVSSTVSGQTGIATVHRPLSRSLASNPQQPPLAMRKSQDLLLEYGLDFAQMSTSQASSGSGFYHQAPMRPPSRPPPPPMMSATPAAAVTGATPSIDPFEDLDPLRSSLASPQPQTPMSDHHNPPSRKSYSTSVNPHEQPRPPVAPPRTKKASMDSSLPPSTSRGASRQGWATFDP